tara:strand:- start:1199 stop:1459 length:261 start_codon:yes stop_codon:yes gene_type:complete
MYILCLDGKEAEGAYAIQHKKERTLLIFSELEDAERFVGLLEADDFPPMSTVKVDAETMIEMCESTGHNYTVIQPNELIIPPSHDL